MKKVVVAVLMVSILVNLVAGIYWLSLSLLIALAVLILLSLRWGDSAVLKRIVFLKTPLLFLIAVVLAIGLRLFFFGVYNVGSNSMRDTMIQGDYVWVNKLIYGPLLPTTVYDIPWVGVGYWLIKGKPKDTWREEMIPFRLKGWGSVEKNDVVVFNKPGTADVFIKRCIARPGDTLEMREGVVLVNGRVLVNAPKVKRGGPIVPAWKVYPGLDSLGWDIDNWGPYILPYRGMEIRGHESSTIIYRKLIALCEGASPESLDIITGPQSGVYVFKHDYYFMLGDNRHGSHDSRFFGPVPDYGIVGKATFIIFSQGEGLDSGRRFLRGFNR